MKFLLLLLFAAITVPVFSQNEFVENKEGFDNLPKGTLRKEIACFSNFSQDEKNNSISHGKTKVAASGNNFMTFKRENVTVTVRIKSFDKSKHKIKKNADGLITAIDGKPVFGKDFGRELPSVAIRSVVVTIGADTLRLPQSAYANLFETNLCSEGESLGDDNMCPKIFFSADKRRIYIFSMHSDGAGAYEVTWVIQDKRYLRRVVDYGY